MGRARYALVPHSVLCEVNDYSVIGNAGDRKELFGRSCFERCGLCGAKWTDPCPFGRERSREDHPDEYFDGRDFSRCRNDPV